MPTPSLGSPEVEEAVKERRKAFTAAHTSGKDRRFASLLPVIPLLLASKPKARYGRQHGHFSLS